MAGFAGNLVAGKPFALTTDIQEFEQFPGVKINYSSAKISGRGIRIQPHQILFSDKIEVQSIGCEEIDGEKIFFQTPGDWPFDIFAASFYLISRYEEYLPHREDEYGRYAHENSIAFKEGFLHLPLVNIWWARFKKRLAELFPEAEFSKSQFVYIPTYDIDIAWSYRHKGWQRTAGGLARSLFNRNWSEARSRLSVWRGRDKDPYDSYTWLHQLHERFKVKPYYFFLLANKKGVYDKNISPRNLALRELVREHFNRYPVGIHPSWRSGDEHGLLRKEISTISEITESACVISRQHYIRFHLPDTFRRLIDAGIRYEFSMGYGSINGFRASVTTPYYWYDLKAEQTTELLLFPFCYMEANSFYEQKYTAAQALEEMRHYRKQVKLVNGTLITIWHNHFLGTDPSLSGWRETYETFMSETAETR